MPPIYPPPFDELHSISDLHLGGVPGAQTFNQGELLARTIDHLRQKSPDKRMVLVINGDAVDFLIEPNPVYLDPDHAVNKLDHIFEEAAFAPFWQALTRYVQTPGRWLAVTLGNHDLELVLPAVRARFIEVLSGGDPAARGRITMALDGTGYSCTVGGAHVFCVHGNEVDTWNVADHDALRRVARDLNRGVTPEDWTPNAGTKMVIDIINYIKRDWPLIDFLKPEDKVVLPVIVALDPSQAKRVAGAAPILLRLVGDSVRMRTGFLSADMEEAVPPSEAEALEHLMGGVFSSHDPTTTNVDDLLEMAEEGLDGGPAATPVRQSDDDEMLGMGSIIMDLIRKRSPVENLRDALLEWLGDDRTFDFTAADSTFKLIDEKIGPDVDFVLTGHTHLEKALRRKNGRGAYFNSGTWIRLIQLTPEILNDAPRFASIFKAFQGRTLQALDEEPGLVLLRPTVVSIEQDDAGAFGELRRPTFEDGSLELRSVEGSRHRAG